MDSRYERIIGLHRLLSTARRPVTIERMIEVLGSSRATAYRDIAFLRDALGAPIEQSEEPAGYFYPREEADRFELPGLWLSSTELHALLAANQLLERTGAGVLSDAVAPLRERIETLLAEQGRGRRWPIERIRVLSQAGRALDQPAFRAVATALLERQRLAFEYRARSTDATTRRVVSPQRLTHYRDNWYLDAFDESRDGLRSFALDRVRAPKVLAETARDIDETELDRELASGYGIFSGPAKGTATILFSPHAARWVADERWHSRQEGRFLDDGRFELKLPYSNPKELLMDVMRYGPDAEVIAPPALRQEAKILLRLALAAYD